MRRALALGLLLSIVALILDLWGITWGLPSIRNVRSFHPDEYLLINSAQRVDPFHGKLNPGFYNYGSLYIYALWTAFQIAQLFGMLNAHPALQDFDPDNQAVCYLVARGVTVAFSVGAVLLTWQLGRRLWGEWAGGIAGLLLAASPLFAVHSHYSTVDVPATFWMVSALLACAVVLRMPVPAPVTAGKGKTVRPKRPGLPPALVLGAIASGLAAGTKYNAGLSLIACWLTWTWRFLDTVRLFPAASGKSQRAHFWADLGYGWLVLGTVAFGSFLVSTPGFIGDRSRFIDGFRFELWHSRTGHEYVFSHTAPGFVHHLTQSLWIGMGPPLCTLAVAGAVYALARRTRHDLLLAVVVIPYYLVIGTAQVKFMRYTIPLLPFLCLWAARLLAAGFPRDQARTNEDNRDRESGSGLAGSRRRQASVWLILSVAGGFALLESLAYDRVLAGPDVRYRAADWVVDHVRPYDSIGLVETPWFDTPAIMPKNIHMEASVLQQQEDQWGYNIRITGWNPSILEREHPHFFILTERQVRYLDRIHRLEPGGSSPAARAGREAAAFQASLRSHYRLVATFRTTPHLGPVNFQRSFVPDDWLYPDPTIWIWERR